MLVCTDTPQAGVEALMHPTRQNTAHDKHGLTAQDLAQLLVDAEVIHHDGAVQDFQQRVLRKGLLGLLRGSP